MKRLSIIFLLLTSLSFAFEDVPIFPQDSGIGIIYLQNDSSLINTDKMRRSEKIKQAENEVLKNEKPKVKFDTRQMNHQRALDFTTRQSNSMPLPRF